MARSRSEVRRSRPTATAEQQAIRDAAQARFEAYLHTALRGASQAECEAAYFAWVTTATTATAPPTAEPVAAA